jgi:hypothetical protein
MMRSLFSILNLKCGQAEEAEEEKEGEVQRSQVSKGSKGGYQKGRRREDSWKKRKEKKRARYPEQRCE